MTIDAIAKLITAMGALLSAVACPIAIVMLVWYFRAEIKLSVAKLPSLVDRMRKMKIAGVEAELDRIASTVEESHGGEVTSEQIEVAAKIAVDADDLTADLLSQLDKLCLEYDALRRSMPSSAGRTTAFTRVMVKMRALAPALVSHIEVYKGSASPGSRLAAIAMMQMNPNSADIDWLAFRFEKDMPFIFYHAALAMQNLANNALTSEEWDQLLGAAQRSFDVVNSFAGKPDQSTIDILGSLISSIRQ